jgi:hypothetical protein
MGKRYLSNAHVRVPPIYAKRLARVEREVWALKQRLDTERAIRLYEIEKRNFSDQTSAGAVAAAVRAVESEFEFIQRNVNARRVATLEALLDENYPAPPKPLWRRIIQWWRWRYFCLGFAIYMAVALIGWVARHVD